MDPQLELIKISDSDRLLHRSHSSFLQTSKCLNPGKITGLLQDGKEHGRLQLVWQCRQVFQGLHQYHKMCLFLHHHGKPVSGNLIQAQVVAAAPALSQVVRLTLGSEVFLAPNNLVQLAHGLLPITGPVHLALNSRAKPSIPTRNSLAHLKPGTTIINSLIILWVSRVWNREGAHRSYYMT